MATTRTATTTIDTSDRYRDHRRLARAWLAIGALVVLFVPAARVAGGTFGWLPFWLVVAPMLVLAQLEVLGGFARAHRWRRRLAQAGRARRTMARRQPALRRIARVA